MCVCIYGQGICGMYIVHKWLLLLLSLLWHCINDSVDVQALQINCVYPCPTLLLLLLFMLMSSFDKFHMLRIYLQKTLLPSVSAPDVSAFTSPQITQICCIFMQQLRFQISFS